LMKYVTQRQNKERLNLKSLKRKSRGLSRLSS